MTAPQSVLRCPVPAHLATILQQFPPVAFAFAYGSGAHHQPGLYDDSHPQLQTAAAPVTGQPSPSDTTVGSARGGGAGPQSSTSGKGPVIDFIFAVQDAHEWHRQNLLRNPDHYSWVGRLGANAVCGICEAVGVGVHFNPLVRVDERTTIKYGVLEVSSLDQDLTCWTHLYVAGRMHKPVTPLTVPAPPDVAAAQDANRHNALAAALALLPPIFTEEELLRTIVGLSYRGDIRLAVGAEDPHKVARIVAGSWGQLHDMYLPLLAGDARYRALGVERAGEVTAPSPSPAPSALRLWRQAVDPDSRGRGLQLLPAGLLHEMAARLGFHVPPEHLAAGAATQREVVAAALRAGRPQQLVGDSVAALVRRSSIYQAAAGLLAAGGGKAVQYVGAKLAKALRPLGRAAAGAAARGTGGLPLGRGGSGRG